MHFTVVLFTSCRAAMSLKSPQKKRIKYVTGVDSGSPASVSVDTVDWSRASASCAQELQAGTASRSRPLNCPAYSAVAAQRPKVNSSLAKILQEFRDFVLQPSTINLDALADGVNLETSLINHKALWHVTCGLKL